MENRTEPKTVGQWLPYVAVAAIALYLVWWMLRSYVLQDAFAIALTPSTHAGARLWQAGANMAFVQSSGTFPMRSVV